MVTWGDPELSCCDSSTISFITGECVGNGSMRRDHSFEEDLKGPSLQKALVTYPGTIEQQFHRR